MGRGSGRVGKIREGVQIYSYKVVMEIQSIAQGIKSIIIL